MIFLKTNKKWYPEKDMGSFYRLENGVLMFCPMNTDGSRDNSGGEVDFLFLEGEYLDLLLEGEYLGAKKEKLVTDRLKEIGNELLRKI